MSEQPNTGELTPKFNPVAEYRRKSGATREIDHQTIHNAARRATKNGLPQVNVQFEALCDCGLEGCLVPAALKQYQEQNEKGYIVGAVPVPTAALLQLTTESHPATAETAEATDAEE